MKLKREEIQTLGRLILRSLCDKNLVTLRVSESQIQAKIEAVIVKNIQEEAAIEEEVKKIMEQYRAQIASGSIDPQRVYMMIKKQVAKDRKFIL